MVRKLFKKVFGKSTKSKSVFAKKKKARMPKLDVEQLRTDLKQVYLNPKQGIALREKWSKLFPRNIEIQEAFKGMASWKLDPSRKFQVSQPVNPKTLNDIASSFIYAVESANSRLRQGQALEGYAQAYRFKHSKSYRKTLQKTRRAEVSRRKANVKLVEEAITRNLKKQPKGLKPRIKEVSGILLNRFQVSDILSYMTGVSTKGFSGLRDLDSLSRNAISSLNSVEAKDVAWFVPALANEIAVRERKAGKKIPNKAVELLFDSQYQHFLEVREKIPKEKIFEQLRLPSSNKQLPPKKTII